jgi:hypothetical protein
VINVRGPNNAQLVFIATLGKMRPDGLPNYHCMFRNDYVSADVLPYFNEVLGPFRKYTIAICAKAYDLTGNGVDDLLVCNDKGVSDMYFQSTTGQWADQDLTKSATATNYLYGWQDLRVADVVGDQRPDLVVVPQERSGSYLRVFAGIPRPPYFNFAAAVYEYLLPYPSHAVEVLDVNQDGNYDIYVVQSDEITRGTYCGTGNNPSLGNKTLPLDKAADLLFLGKNRHQNLVRRGYFTPIAMQHKVPGCGGPVAQAFGNNYTMILSEGNMGHTGRNVILRWQ